MRKENISVVVKYLGERQIYTFQSKDGDMVDAVNFNVEISEGERKEVVEVTSYRKHVKEVLDFEKDDLICINGYFNHYTKTVDEVEKVFVNFVSLYNFKISKNAFEAYEEIKKSINIEDTTNNTSTTDTYNDGYVTVDNDIYEYEEEIYNEF